MKKFALAVALTVVASSAFAGGVEPTMDPGVVVETTSSSAGGIIVPLLLLIVLGVALTQ